MRLSEAKKIRKYIEKAASSLTDEDAVKVPRLFPAWSTGTAYNEGDRVLRGDSLYRCITEHTSQETWTPETAVSLFVKVSDPFAEYPSWVQPTGAHDAYLTGDKVSHADTCWVSVVDANVYEPGVYGWEEVIL